MLNFTLDDSWIAYLLALPSQHEQFAALSAAQLFDEAGLTRLWVYGNSLVQRNPDQARQLAQLGYLAAQQIGVATLLPRMLYTYIQSHAINGELPLALDLVRSALFWLINQLIATTANIF
jgi:hypothetical protein